MAAQREDSRSLLALYRRLIALRRAEPVLVAGRYMPVAQGTQVLAYRREAPDRRLLVVLNLGGDPAGFNLHEIGKILVSTGLDREGETVERQLDLRGNEGVVVALGASPSDSV